MSPRVFRKTGAAATALLLSLSTFAFAGGESPKVCAISLLKGDSESQLLHASFERLTGTPLRSSHETLDLFENAPKAIVDCFQGTYDTIVLVMHSTSISSGSVSLTYYRANANGERQPNFLPDLFFTKIQISPTIRRFWIATCEAERLEDNYSELYRVMREHGIEVRFAEGDIQGGYRSIDSAAGLIADSLK